MYEIAKPNQNKRETVLLVELVVSSEIVSSVKNVLVKAPFFPILLLVQHLTFKTPYHTNSHGDFFLYQT